MSREDRDWLAFLIGHTTAFGMIAIYTSIIGPVHYAGPLVLTVIGVAGIAFGLITVKTRGNEQKCAVVDWGASRRSPARDTKKEPVPVRSRLFRFSGQPLGRRQAREPLVKGHVGHHAARLNLFVLGIADRRLGVEGFPVSDQIVA